MATAQAQAHAQDMLARNTMALQAVTAMQEAARAAAVGATNLGANPNFVGQTLPDVPDGLATGGLEINGAPVGANSPQQSLENARTIVSIQQTQQQALLNWKTFNVGSNTTVRFDQSAGGEDVGNWIAFNTIDDPTGNPTQILGSIEAQGQVYLINQNGIIFGGGSQVNTHALVASSLPMNDNLVTRGLLNNPDSQFLFSANAQAAGTKGPTPAYTPPALPASGKIGDVTVQAGAQITAPTSAANVGGRVALIGPNVTNNGTISTPDGQTILAAGRQVGIAAHTSSDASLRGLDVYVGDVGTEGSATNNGIIDAPRANVTMVGKSIHQMGVIESTTSVMLNGRIDIDASYDSIPNSFYDAVNRPSDPPFLKRSTGAVEFGANSVMQILPEWSSDLTVVGTELALRSQINVTGLSVYLGNNSVVYAPNANVAISAGVWEYTSSAAASTNTLVHSSGQIYLDEGAEIDVQGSTDIQVPVTQYIQDITLHPAELANFPVQRNSILLGSTITVDLRLTGLREDGTVWYGTPIADLTGYVGVIQRTVGELTIAGGTVTLNAGNSVVVQPTAHVDVSGGWINYDGATVQTSKLVSSGQIIAIADADPNVRYDGIYQGEATTTDTAYGVTTTTTSIWSPGSYYEPGYLRGGDGGGLSITSASMALDGQLTGLAVSGLHQREIPANTASLELTWQADISGFPDYFFESPAPPVIQFGATGNQTPAASFALDSNGIPLPLSQDRRDNVVLSPELLSTSGFGHLSVINYDGQIVLGSNVSLQTWAQGSVTLVGANVDVLGSIISPGGTITLTAYNISPSDMARLTRQPPSVDPSPNVGRGTLTIGTTTLLSTAGLLINDTVTTSQSQPRPIIIQGGTIAASAYNIVVPQGSTLDVSGGIYVGTDGAIRYGDAGSISLLAARNPSYEYHAGTQDINLDLKGITGGTITLGGQLLGYSGANGGTLAVQAQMIQIGGTTSDPQALLISSDFFSRGGFTNFVLTGFGTVGGADYLPAINITPGTQIAPRALSYVASSTNVDTDGISLTTLLAPEGVRKPVSLSFNAPGLTDDFSTLLTVRGDLVLGLNSSITTDALGAIRFNVQTASIQGSLSAPGGTIDLLASSQFPSLQSIDNAQPTLFVASGAVLSAAGKSLLLPDAFGRKIGTVLEGGTIHLQGNIVAASGSVMNVSGATDTLDVNVAYLGQAVGTSALTTSGIPNLNVTTQLTRVDSSAGTISLTGGEELFVDSQLLGTAGGPQALGGTLAISSGRFYSVSSGTIPDPRDINLWVTQSGPVLPSSFAGIGNPVRKADNSIVSGAGYFAADSFLQGGFDSLSLAGNVGFVGQVDITAAGSLAVATKGIIQADNAVNLTASYVSLGRAFLNPQQPQEVVTPYTKITGAGNLDFFYFPPTFGTGSLTVTAKLIDVGTLSLQGVGHLNLIADNGEIRGDGVLDVAGSIYLRAAQIYPPTATTFNIIAYDYTVAAVNHAGSVTIVGSGQHSLPLSAGGTLNIYASQITQGGTLVAPFGTINLGWDGIGGWDGGQTAPKDLITNLTVPVTSQLTLATGSVTSVSGVDRLTGNALTIPYGINLNGTSWIDPRGIDITGGGGPEKAIHLSSLNVTTQTGSVIDLTGGGELYAYRWISGNGGTNDVLALDSNFAVISGYSSAFAPFGAYNRTASSSTLGTDAGYVNSTLHAGDQVYLSASNGLQAGVYTLLPARYALLPGAFLVTPQNDAPSGTVLLPSGASLVNGYRFDGLNSRAAIPSLMSSFEVAPGSVVRSMSQYDDYTATVFLAAQAAQFGVVTPELPPDAGHVVLQAVQTMSLQGVVLGQFATNGRGALVDISSPVDIVITAPGAPAVGGKLQLDASGLSTIGAGSMLIGGVRSTSTDGTHVTVRTNNLTVDNAGSPLSGQEILLVAKRVLEVKSGSQIVQNASGTSGGDEPLIFGDSGTLGSGDGTLLRVSDNSGATITRLNITGSTLPNLIVGAGVLLQGNSLTLDTTFGTSLDPSAILNSSDISLNSGSVTLQLDNTVVVPVTQGLLLSGSALQSLQNSSSLSLLSYSTLDIYGAGQVGDQSLVNLALHAGQIRGFSQSGGTASFVAQNILLDNSANAANGTSVAGGGVLSFEAAVVRLGSGTLQANQFASVQIVATSGLQLEQTGGLTTNGAMTVTTPVIAGLAGAVQSIRSDGTLIIQAPGSITSLITTEGLGASLTLQGSQVELDTQVRLPSGSLSVIAQSGDININGMLNLGGVRRDYRDLSQYTNGGQVSLTSNTGNVNVGVNAEINVSADTGGGSAGSVSVSTPLGTFLLSGTVHGRGGVGGENGTFVLDVNHLGALNLGTLAGPLDPSFTESLSVRVRNGDVTVSDSIKAHVFQLAADNGSITVANGGVIDSSGSTGGTVRLVAHSNVTLQNGAQLTVAAQDFDSAGKGGQISLEAGAGVLSGGAYTIGTGTLDVQSGSSIDLSVAASAGLGQFSGTLHLRAPQISGGTDVSVNAIQGTIIGASNVTVEGYFVQDLTGTGTITTAVQNNVQSKSQTFMGAGYTAMFNRIVGTNALNTNLSSILVLQPGAEIVNRTGDLTLGTTTSTTTSDWNLSTYRFGPKSAPGVLTLRAAGNLVFYNALSDGFTPTLASSNASWLWLAPVSAQNSQLPVNMQSWSYHMTAGADLNSVDYHAVQSLSTLSGSSGLLSGATAGSLLLGKNGGLNLPTAQGSSALTSTAITKLYQVIRTGTGDIDISAGGDVLLLNQFATIYTAGVGVQNPTSVAGNNDFVMPVISKTGTQPPQGPLGVVQQTYAASYTLAGGNVVVYAGNDIAHKTQNVQGVLISDSERQMPINWLYRRGLVDTSTGLFGTAGTSGNPLTIINDPTASTTWWIDFSNFFEGVGALGGGNVTLKAGRDVANVDAVAPTNARMPGKDPVTGLNVAPDASKLVVLGGGDVEVLAGRNIDGGVYYVERGHGTLKAGDSITTNATRTLSLGILNGFANPTVKDSSTWLPTTLFVGDSTFDVSAKHDVLLGPMTNAFLLPQGLNNKYWYKTYFTTYSPESAVNVSSLGGSVTFRESVTPGTTTADPLLYQWFTNVLQFSSTSTQNASYYQPWLRLAESSTNAFSIVASIAPPSLKATAFSGDINLVGSLTLFPSANGTIDLIAAGSVNGLRPTGTSTQLVPGQTVVSWAAATINLSDANPLSVPAADSPFGYASVPGVGKATTASTSGNGFLSFVENLFKETGSTSGVSAVLQNKQSLHAPGVLHANDTVPAHIYAGTGDITGLTFYSAKAAQIIAGNDVSDIAFYIQNTRTDSLSIVASGRDIIAYNENTASRIQTRLSGNSLTIGQSTLAGDIQISGPGSLEVLAGRNIDLGTGSNNSDGTGVGITSIGNGRNPYLPFAGSDIVVAAGMGKTALGLGDSNMDFTSFITQFATSPAGDRYLTELADILGVPSVDLNSPSLTAEEKSQLALAIYYLVLRDAGRDHNDPNSPDAGTYTQGYAAINTLLPTVSPGTIQTQARDIRTKSGGNISILAPDGGLQLATTLIGEALAPPGVITEAGGGISIFTKDDVSIGIARIFTLRGGDILIWSSEGDIAAGSSSKTVQSAPPTRVLIDPQSANVATDLAGLATGGGIGVLATVAGVKPANVDLIAPLGAVDAGDAGIRATGNLNIAATVVLNAANISVGGTSSGTPAAAAVSSPSLGSVASAGSSAAAATAATNNAQQNNQSQSTAATTQELPSVITVEVIGYGGGSGDDERKRNEPGE
ncbi:filamentous haemagglutinin family protein [Prosthecobacter sp.]|uniref:filamentous haemagglutinin family protein n=1 Tax=Prosthecobacter sp. TaxID=1965333 RepID=UPI001DC2ECBF|nr:filamentous haemagglutinin family protein [Prosthecobacter sp.]MCB1276967.1 filamentous hemagglutinin family protein [Prosthecobacter sp.]